MEDKIKRLLNIIIMDVRQSWSLNADYSFYDGKIDDLFAFLSQMKGCSAERF